MLHGVSTPMAYSISVGRLISQLSKFSVFVGFPPGKEVRHQSERHAINQKTSVSDRGNHNGAGAHEFRHVIQSSMVAILAGHQDLSTE